MVIKSFDFYGNECYDGKMTKSKNTHFQAVNDNRHDQFMWELLFKWLDIWFDKNRIPRESLNYNRALHYMYELKNRPWMSKEQTTREALLWLEDETVNQGFPIIWPA